VEEGYEEKNHTFYRKKKKGQIKDHCAIGKMLD
jgi:hypothetical protein